MNVFNNPKIKEIWKKSSEWEVWFDGNNVRFEVFQKFNKSGNQEFVYTAIADTAVQAKGAAAPYRSIRESKTEMEALADAINGFLAFYGNDSKLVKEK